ncbi:glycosyl hydrolase [Aquirufa echingensis]|uniref:Glycosyl hydrolase n=1 Tax=Aquirufa echingensis TaxID=3096516 RepID=A0ABW6CYC6_9BACT
MKKHFGFAALVVANLTAYAQVSDLSKGFVQPPHTAQPRVWWHWMNGNITKDGIRKDLDWMKQSGIGGFQNFDASLFTPLAVKEKLVYMTPAWKDAFRFATDYAKEKGLEMAIAGSPGWSVTGGPWVAPSDGMKKYVWSELRVQGGQKITVALPHPSDITGPMQNVPFEAGGFAAGSAEKVVKHYQDIAVLAYPIASQIQSARDLKPQVSSSGGQFNLAELTDGDLHHMSYLPPMKIGEQAWIQYTFEAPTEISSVMLSNESYGELAAFNGGGNNRSIQVSADGVNFSEVVKVPPTITSQTTVSFAPQRVKAIRLCYQTEKPGDVGIAAMFGMRPSTEPKGMKISEFNVFTTPRLHLFEAKAGFEAHKELAVSGTPVSKGPAANQVIDVTKFVQADGTLSWDAPAGNWEILRFGYSLTGKKNHPASPEATGLEVDKLDRGAVTRYMENYLDQYAQATGGQLGPGALSHMVLDSYEAGHMNWSPTFAADFQAKRGYDLKPWMPVLTGRIVQDAEASERFLWDFRKTIGELIVENHYELIGDLLAKRGMKRYTESHENGRIYLADGMDVKRKADIPMAAMWQPGALAAGKDEEPRSRADIRESASVAHIYGQNIVAGESMTTAGNSFSPHPGTLKRTADMELASGLNRFVIHTSVHQPLDSLFPGLTLGPFGQWFTRQETWAKQAKIWADYLGRSSYMLQQGHNVADILYYYGENQNITSLAMKSLPSIPAGFEFDYVNASALRDAIDVEKGQFVSRGGSRYQLLYLDETAKQMTLVTLKRIFFLAQKGAWIAGTKPISSPSLADSEQEFQRVLTQLISLPSVHFGHRADAVLASKSLAADLRVSGNSAEVLFQHRQVGDKEIYWVNSRSDQANKASLSFRVSGKIPQVYNPETGEISALSYRMQEGRTLIDMEFSPWDAKFIVFEGNAKTKSLVVKKPAQVSSMTISGPWQVKFQENRGAPEMITMSELQAWNQHADAGIKYFSGTATYSHAIEVPSTSAGSKWQLDLGDVKNLAEIYVNGQWVATCWKQPFVADISKQLHAGANQLEVKVVNSWVNRLVGDAQPNVKRITYLSMPMMIQPTMPLETSGLLGPVQIHQLK